MSRALVLELIQRDMNILNSRTGTRISGSISTSPTVILHRSGEQSGPEYYLDIRRRLASRLDYLRGKVEINDDAIAEDLKYLERQERQLRQELTLLDNP